MRRVLTFLAAALLALAPISPANAIPARLAVVLSGVQIPGPNPYVPPTLSAFSDLEGDSRFGLSHGYSLSGTTVSQVQNIAEGAAAWLPIATSNKLLFATDYNYGLPSASTAHHAGIVNVAGNSCNHLTSTGAESCFTGRKTTMGASALIHATTLQLTATTGMSIGDILFVTGNVNYLTITNVVDATHVTVSSPGVSAAISNGAVVVTTPLANSTAYGSYLSTNPNPYTGSIEVDSEQSVDTTGAYSPCNSPSTVVYHMGGSADDAASGMAIGQTLINEAAFLDAFGPTGCNKLVVAANEIPRTTGSILNERYVIASGSVALVPGTVTDGAGTTTAGGGTITGLYVEDDGVWYAPAAVLGTPNTLGTNDGVALTFDGYGCASPAVRHYCVTTATGTYIFNAADNGAAVAISYRWNTPGAAQHTALPVVHAWYNSASAAFSYLGTPYYKADGTTPLPGAQYQRPWVKVALTWEALDDGSGFAKFGMLGDGIHFQPAGARAFDAALNTAAAAQGALAGSAFATAPTQNNIVFSGHTTTAAGAAVTSTCKVANGNVPIGTDGPQYYIWGITSPVVSSGVFAIGQRIEAAAVLSISGALIDCVDTTNSVVHMSGIGTPITNSATGLIAQADQTSLLANGIPSHLNPATSSQVASCGTSRCANATGATIGTPVDWTFQWDAASTTVLNAGTMYAAYGITTGDAFVIQLGGIAGASQGSATFSQALPAAMIALIAGGDKHRLFCTVTLGAGPNGHISGINQIQIADAPASTTSTSAWKAWTSKWGAGYAALGGSAPAQWEFSDLDAGTSMPVYVPLSDMTGWNGTISETISVTVGWDLKRPVSGTITVSGCRLQKVTQ